MRSYFPKAVSYRRFVCLANVCRLINDTGGQNLRGYDNKVFKGITADGRGRGDGAVASNAILCVMTEMRKSIGGKYNIVSDFTDLALISSLYPYHH